MSATTPPAVDLTKEQKDMIASFVAEMQRAQKFNLELRTAEVTESTRLAAAKRRVQEG